MGRTWIGAKISVVPGRTWKRRVQVQDWNGEPHDWYELQIVTWTPHGTTFKGTAIGTLEQMKDAGERQPHGYRIVYTGVVLDRSAGGSVCPGEEVDSGQPKGEGQAGA